MSGGVQDVVTPSTRPGGMLRREWRVWSGRRKCHSVGPTLQFCVPSSRVPIRRSNPGQRGTLLTSVLRREGQDDPFKVPSRPRPPVEVDETEDLPRLPSLHSDWTRGGSYVQGTCERGNEVVSAWKNDERLPLKSCPVKLPFLLKLLEAGGDTWGRGRCRGDRRGGVGVEGTGGAGVEGTGGAG